MKLFSQPTADWFSDTFGMPTRVQEEAWAAIAKDKDVLVSAPTGTGKTLSAFLIFIDRLNALAAGGAIICSQYIGQGDHKNAGRSANQLVFVVTVISAAVTAACLAFRMPLLKLIFGQHIRRIEILKLRCFLRPAEGREGPQRGRKPGVKRIFILM